MVVRVDESGTLGVVSADTLGVWTEYDLTPRRMNFRDMPRVRLPALPFDKNDWVSKSVGGVSGTVRLNNLVRARLNYEGPVTLFATHMPSPDTALHALASQSGVTLGESEVVDSFGNVAEVVVHDAIRAAHVAAVLLRANARVVMEKGDQRAYQSLGVERLDRIDARITKRDTEDDRDTPEAFGLGRGDRNWSFDWIPQDWCVPITWDYMVRNMDSVKDVGLIPQPLRQYVAIERIAKLQSTREDPRDPDVAQRIAALRQHVPRKRIVSAGLSHAQSKQIIAAYYLLSVEQVQDTTTRRAAQLILYRYMMERGYTGRWLGPYKQNGKFVGNGGAVRKFRRLSQYAPHRLPSSVLNKLCSRTGKLTGRGSKGSRSKYVAKQDRYIPQKRRTRSLEDEARMRSVTA